MTRHFLGILFWSFIGFIVFVNLIQFSGATLPVESCATDVRDTWENSYFGFSSLFKFFNELGNNPNLINGMKIMDSGVRIINAFSLDDLSDFLTTLDKLSQETPGLVVIFVLSQFFTLIRDILILPVTLTIGLIVVVIGAFVYLWNLLTMFFGFLLGQYNVAFRPVIV